MKHLLSLLLLLLSLALSAQGILPGIVTFQNSGNTPVAGASVSTDLGNSQETGADGTFLMALPGKAPGYEVYLSVDYPGYEVVNKEDRLVTLKADNSKRSKYYLCPKGQWNRFALEFYEINEQAITLRYRREVQTLQARIQDDRLRSDSLALLRKAFDAALAETKRLSEDFAKANLDDANETYRLAYRYFSRGQLDSALNLLRLENPVGKLETAQQNKSELQRLLALQDSVIHTQIQNALLQGRLYATRFQFDSAVYCYQAAVEADTTDFDNVFEFARFLHKQNQFKPANQQYERALRLAATPDQEASILNNLGVALMEQNDYAHAVSALEDALKTRRKLADEVNPDIYLPQVAQTLHNLGNTWDYQNDPVRSIPAYEEALNIFRKLAETNPESYIPYIAKALSNLGIALTNQNNYARAISSHEESLKLYRKLAETNQNAYLPDLAYSLVRMGVTCRKQHDYFQATLVYQEAMTIFHSLSEINPEMYLPGKALVLNNMGNIFLDQNKYPQAISNFEEALKIRRKLAEINPPAYLPDIAMTVINLGKCYWLQKNYTQAIFATDEALSIYRKLAETEPNAYNRLIVITLINLGNSWSELRNYELCVSIYEEALAISRKLADINPDAYQEYIGMILNNLGLILMSQKDYEKAIPAFKEALIILGMLAEAHPEVYQHGVAMTSRNLGIAYAEQNSNQESILCLQEAVKIHKKLAEENIDAFGVDAASSLIELGIAYFQTDSIQEGRRCWAEAQEILIHSPAIIRCGEVYGDLSHYALEAKEFLLAETAAKRAMELDSIQSSTFITNLGHSYLLRGRYQEAQQAYKPLLGKQDDSGKPYEQIILEDLAELEKEGVTHPDVKKVRRWLMP
ncbi:MAG: tetratricopeptide repeat protein [Bacteroidia bacterium]|nr:tetratricopeptide repeat protein [Bacteroidia bacterium]